MATRGEWNRLIDLAWDLALVEDDLRAVVALGDPDYDDAARILWERFGVRTDD